MTSHCASFYKKVFYKTFMKYSNYREVRFKKIPERKFLKREGYVFWKNSRTVRFIKNQKKIWKIKGNKKIKKKSENL